MPPSNAKVILAVALTICACALMGVGVEAMCVIYKIPDMNTPLSGGFLHVVDTLIGALIAMLINTRTQPPLPSIKDVGPSKVVVTNEPDNPVPTTET